KVGHGLEHRDLDETTATGAAALHERAQHTVRRIDAGDRIRERRPEKSRLRAVDHHAQEAAQSLSDRIVAGTSEVGTAAARAADGAIVQALVHPPQPGGAGAEPIGGTGTEVLDE